MLRKFFVWVLLPFALVACDDGGGGGSDVDAGIDAVFGDAGDPSDALPEGPDAQPGCTVGTENCNCLGSGACRLDGLTCVEGICRDLDSACDPSVERCPPESPRCYAPCLGDVVDADGTARLCSAEGLLDGCLDGQTCDRGTCIADVRQKAAGDPGYCERDSHCPDFQTCIRERCYSDCESDSDCESECQADPDCESDEPVQVCRRHVCRPLCGEQTPCASADQACTDGICMPLVEPGEPPVRQEGAEFEVLTPSLKFTSSSDAGQLRIKNTGRVDLTVTITKAEQRAVTEQGNDQLITEDALLWLSIAGSEDNTVSVDIAVGETAEVEVEGAKTDQFTRWEGALTVSLPGFEQRVNLTYSQQVAGRWVGTAYSFGSFPDGARPQRGQYPLDTWIADPDASLDDVPNAFLRAWSRLRKGTLSRDRMDAILDATLGGSWNFPRVRELCEASEGVGAVCAPFNNADGVILYTSDGADLVPRGAVEMDFALHLKPGAAGDCDGAENCFVGRIDSDTALQYGANPKVSLTFEGDPTDCDRQDSAGCTAFVSSLDAKIVVGGRYNPSSDTCQVGYERVERPWLVEGFKPPFGILNAEENAVKRVDCQHADWFLTDANPIPDSKRRERTLELVDGMMIEQNVMSLILRETVDPFHGGERGMANYLYVVLERSSDAPSTVDTTASQPPRSSFWDVYDPSVSCGGYLNQPAFVGWGPVETEGLVNRLIAGRDGAPTPLPAGEVVYALCIWSEDDIQTTTTPVEIRPGVFEEVNVNSALNLRREAIIGGRDGDTQCFPGAQVLFFTLPEAQGNPADWHCNDTVPETCLAHLATLVEQGEVSIRTEQEARPELLPAGENVRFDLTYTCDDGAITCDQNRYDVRDFKTFYAAGEGEVVDPPLENSIARAFRYKTQFTSRTGAQIGFAPTLCEGGGDLQPYCYNAEAIEAIRDRVDCAIALFHANQEGFARLSDEDEAMLTQFLVRNFSALQINNADNDPILSYGFERLYAELLIMLGDDAYTASFASRFDLAVSSQKAFNGSQLEDDGIDLSGPAGYEMYRLYEAAQHYDLVLERFAAMSGYMWQSLALGDGDRYITRATVTTYLDRVIRASTQSAQVWNAVAKRYRDLNKPDLARRVLARAFTRAHQDSMIMTGFMQRVIDRIDPEAVSEVQVAIEDASRRYRVAMLDMRTRYLELSSGTDVFGTPPEFIPFPALNEDDVNGFEVMLDRAQSRLELAIEDEVTALSSRRDFDGDAASFQSELVSLRNGYETALGEICGTFIADDGRTYPAIPRHAHRSPLFEGKDDPCGAVENGSFYIAGADLQTLQLDLERVRQEASNNLAEQDEAFELVTRQCELINEDAMVFATTQGAINGLDTAADHMRSTIDKLDKVHEIVSETTGRINDVADSMTPVSAALKSTQNGVYLVSAGVNLLATSGLQLAIDIAQSNIRDLELDYEVRNIQRECTYLQAELGYTLRGLHREMLLIEMDILNALWNVQVGFSEIQALANERNRIESERQDAERMLVDVAAAQSDPNVRIYKNDAILNADRSFDRAVKAAWHATRNYEYYTASSYADREQLFLVRMATAGDINLRRYMQDLEDAFFEFEQSFGNPDTRVQTVSLREDILRVPYHQGGKVLSQQERVEKVRDALYDPANLDETGALSFSFATGFDDLSPLTSNHKILFIEVEFFGRNIGDDVGRVYLRQVGTGLVDGTDGRRRYFTFPQRTAVMNPFFNGNRAFGQDADGAIAGPTRSVYRSHRFRERPLVQSNWELVLDQRNESVNQDINLAGLDDIVVYIYYTDFTRD